MKKLALALLMVSVTLTLPVAAGQTPDLSELMTDYARRGEDNNHTLLVVHMNDLTTDALFTPPLKFSLRAQARMGTMFYVEGEAKRDIEVVTEFYVQQDGANLRTTPVSMVNFESGAAIKGGDEFRGFLQVQGPVNLRNPFSVLVGDFIFDFEMNPNAVNRLQQ